MIKDLKNLFNSDVRVIITEGDYVNPRLIFKGTLYEVPSSLDHRVIDSNGAKVYNNTLVVHLIKSNQSSSITVEKFIDIVTFLLVKKMLIKLTPFSSKHIIASKDIPADVMSMITKYAGEFLYPGSPDVIKTRIANLKAIDVRVINNKVDNILFVFERSIIYSDGVKEVLCTFSLPLIS